MSEERSELGQLFNLAIQFGGNVLCCGFYFFVIAILCGALYLYDFLSK